jgi:AcrR family transcriptional regulator
MATANATGLRERKKAATRQTISDIATRLFLKRGFENVTVDEIAEQANVSRLTVFNYFPRKEDLFFDREGEAEALIEAALAKRPKGEALPVSLRRLFKEWMKTGHPFSSFNKGIAQFWRTVRNSPALSARAREMRDQFAERLAEILAAAAGRSASDVEARFAAAILVAAWTRAHAEALRSFEHGERSARVEALFVTIIERGLTAMSAALSGTRYG